MSNFQMETQQNTDKCKNLNLAVFLGIAHLHRAKTRPQDLTNWRTLFFCPKDLYL